MIDSAASMSFSLRTPRTQASDVAAMARKLSGTGA